VIKSHAPEKPVFFNAASSSIELYVQFAFDAPPGFGREAGCAAAARWGAAKPMAVTVAAFSRKARRDKVRLSFIRRV